MRLPTAPKNPLFQVLAGQRIDLEINQTCTRTCTGVCMRGVPSLSITQPRSPAKHATLHGLGLFNVAYPYRGGSGHFRDDHVHAWDDDILAAHVSLRSGACSMAERNSRMSSVFVSVCVSVRPRTDQHLSTIGTA